MTRAIVGRTFNGRPFRAGFGPRGRSERCAGRRRRASRKDAPMAARPIGPRRLVNAGIVTAHVGGVREGARGHRPISGLLCDHAWIGSGINENGRRRGDRGWRGRFAPFCPQTPTWVIEGRRCQPPPCYPRLSGERHAAWIDRVSLPFSWPTRSTEGLCGSAPAVCESRLRSQQFRTRPGDLGVSAPMGSQVCGGASNLRSLRHKG